MMWTLVDSCGLGIVLKPPATGRVFRAFNKLPQGSYGFEQPSSLQPAHHPDHRFSGPEALKSLSFATRERLLAGKLLFHALFKPALARKAAVFITSEDL